MKKITYEKNAMILDGVKFVKRSFILPKRDKEFFNYKGQLYVKARIKSK